MAVSYDPNEVPEISDEMREVARQSGMHVVHIICDEAGAKVGDPSGVSFAAIMPFTPRVGERIKLQDGGRFVVKAVIYKVGKINGYPAMEPTVVALRLADVSPSTDE